MEEQDYNNLISVYQNKLFDFMNQNIALEARELKYRQTIELLNKKIQEQDEEIETLSKTKTTRTTKATKDVGSF